MIDTSLPDNLFTKFTFVGDIHKVKEPSQGDIAVNYSTGEMYCWADSWIDIGPIEEEKEEKKDIKIKAKICECCGGSFKGEKCGWCDTEYVYA